MADPVAQVKGDDGYPSGQSPIKRYPTPHTFSTSGATAPASRSLRRRRDACESSVRVRADASVAARRSRSSSAFVNTRSRLARETQQQLVLLLREQHAAAVDAHVARERVDAKRRRLDDVVRARPHAAQHRVDALDELLVVERPRK